jgi:NAD(P)H-dependent flavin oxidoreductase YrpB (nitropropane dioxygenase family)
MYTQGIPLMNPSNKLPRVIAAPMTGVSDAKLAIACDRAGITGSISIFMDVEDPVSNLDTELDKFCSATGHSNVIVSYGDLDKIFPEGSNKRCLEVLRKWQVSYLYRLNATQSMPEDFTVIGRDYAVYKTEKAAGKTYVESDSLQERIESTSVPVICAGGVYDMADVEYYLNLGAHSVAVGTVLACSVESSIPLDVKQRMITSSQSDLSRFASDGRQALFIKNIDDTQFNHYSSLKLGLKGGDGHVYSGTAITRINKLETVADIASRLLTTRF